MFKHLKGIEFRTEFKCFTLVLVIPGQYGRLGTSRLGEVGIVGITFSEKKSEIDDVILDNNSE